MSSSTFSGERSFTAKIKAASNSVIELSRLLLNRFLLKTKGFSRETETLFKTGGGENRTLVLGKLHKNAYMLSALIVYCSPCCKAPH